MMNLDRFKTLAASYGGRIERWPAEERAAAEALLSQAGEARLLLEAAQAEDRMIAAASAAADSLRAPIEDEAAALVRLRAGVAARIAHLPQSSPAWRQRLRGALAFDLSTLGFATGGGLVLAAGLMIGWLEASTPAAPAAGLMSMLEPAPLQLLAE